MEQEETVIPFQELINQAVKKEREKKEITSWYISQLGNCLRGVYLERLGAEPDKPFDDRTLRVFHCGRLFEDWLLNLLKDKKEINIEREARVESKEFNVSGYIDADVRYNGVRRLYEVKSKHSNAFWYMQREGKAMRQHEYQLWTYLYLVGVERGSIVYISKDDLTIAEYPVLLEDKKLKKEVMAIIKLLNLAWEKKDPTILPLPDDKDWQAKYCRWHSQCKKIKI